MLQLKREGALGGLLPTVRFLVGVINLLAPVTRLPRQTNDASRLCEKDSAFSHVALRLAFEMLNGRGSCQRGVTMNSLDACAFVSPI